MPVNSNKSGARLLAILEHVARAQPVGVRELARSMSIDKSAVQRVLTTLAETGWVQAAPNKQGAWELTTRILHVAHLAHGSNTLRQRARPALDALRDATGETSYLAIPDVDGLVVVEVAESRHSLRMVIPVGSNLTTETDTNSGLPTPFLSPQQHEILVDSSALGNQQEDIKKGSRPNYVIGHEKDDSSSLTMAAPILGADCSVIGVIAICAVYLRIPQEEHVRIGELISQKARELSHSARSELNAESIKSAIGGFG